MQNELARDSYSYIHFALVAGVVLVAFRYRHIHTLNRHRLGLAALFAALTPVATQVPAILVVAIADLPLWAMIFFEHRGYGDRRGQLRREAALGGVGTT
ncbi:MAG TPA: hypothetical protein VF731_07560 [Solirubrobacterales bacterium]